MTGSGPAGAAATTMAPPGAPTRYGAPVPLGADVAGGGPADDRSRVSELDDAGLLWLANALDDLDRQVGRR